MAKVSVLVLPYASVTGNSLAKVLIDNLNDERWTDFTAAVAFLNSSGNSKEMVEAILAFLNRDGSVELTFGADSFGDAMGSDFHALSDLVKATETMPKARIYLYSETESGTGTGRIFHPKVYLFYNETSAVLIIGSSNWSYGGLVDNVEANVVIQLDRRKSEDKNVFDTMLDCFVKYWRQPRE